MENENDMNDRAVMFAWAAVEQREPGHESALDAAGLIVKAAKQALPGEAGAAILRQVDWIGFPQGRTHHRDLGRIIGDHLGARDAVTVFAKFGVMQQTLISEALDAVQSGRSKIALVCGGEAMYRDMQAKRAGTIATVERLDPEVEPDQVLTPAEELMLPSEKAAGLSDAVGFYAIMESVRRARAGQSIRDNREQLGALYADFTKIAAGNPHANRRAVLSAIQIWQESDDNPMIAFPYTKRMVSSWTVDQASVLFMATMRTARDLGIVEDRWIYPSVAVESNAMPTLSAREDMTRSAAMTAMARAGAAVVGQPLAGLDLLDLYSCFPFAVTMAAEGLGVEPGRPLTVTGGMPFAGGPLNNYVFQATCRAADLLGERPDSNATALVSCVSGIYTKQGFIIWSRSMPKDGFKLVDVTAEVEAGERLLPVVEACGIGTIVGYTVLHDRGRPSRAVAVVSLDTGDRTVAFSESQAVMADLVEREGVGRSVRVEDGLFTLA
jgi:acetyl-CoA C-acetyltransferase